MSHLLHRLNFHISVPSSRKKENLMAGLQRNIDTSVFHRAPKTRLRTAVRGEGPYILDDAGNRYIDASGGAAVSCLGHSHPAPIRAIQEQATTLAFAHTGFFTSSAL